MIKQIAGAVFALMLWPAVNAHAAGTVQDDSAVCACLQLAPPVVVSMQQATPLGVPEPSTWAIMVVGIGAVGLGLRRRRPSQISSASRCAAAAWPRRAEGG